MASDWRDRANKRRDERNTKVDDESHKTKRSKKDTIRWCKGKVGREHMPKCFPHKSMSINNKNIFDGWYDLVCSACGKTIDTYRPRTKWLNMELDSRPKPDWVKEDE